MSRMNSTQVDFVSYPSTLVHIQCINIYIASLSWRQKLKLFEVLKLFPNKYQIENQLSAIFTFKQMCLLPREV